LLLDLGNLLFGRVDDELDGCDFRRFGFAGY